MNEPAAAGSVLTPVRADDTGSRRGSRRRSRRPRGAPGWSLPGCARGRGCTRNGRSFPDSRGTRRTAARVDPKRSEMSSRDRRMPVSSRSYRGSPRNWWEIRRWRGWDCAFRCSRSGDRRSSRWACRRSRCGGTKCRRPSDGRRSTGSRCCCGRSSPVARRSRCGSSDRWSGNPAWLGLRAAV